MARAAMSCGGGGRHGQEGGAGGGGKVDGGLRCRGEGKGLDEAEHVEGGLRGRMGDPAAVNRGKGIGVAVTEEEDGVSPEVRRAWGQERRSTTETIAAGGNAMKRRRWDDAGAPSPHAAGYAQEKIEYAPNTKEGGALHES